MQRYRPLMPITSSSPLRQTQDRPNPLPQGRGNFCSPNPLREEISIVRCPYLNLGITLSVRQRMVVITTSRGTEEVQLTSNIISSVLKSSRSISILSQTSSGVPNRLTSVASGLAVPASVLLKQMLDLVREHGDPVPDDELVESGLILPEPDLTLGEAEELFVDEGLLPG